MSLGEGSQRLDPPVAFAPSIRLDRMRQQKVDTTDRNTMRNTFAICRKTPPLPLWKTLSTPCVDFGLPIHLVSEQVTALTRRQR